MASTDTGTQTEEQKAGWYPESYMASGRRFSYLLICHTYPPVLGGSEVEAQRVSAALQQSGHRAKVICSAEPPMPAVKDWVDPCGIPVRIYGQGWPARLRPYIFGIGAAWSLWKERNNYDIAYFLMQGIQLALGLPVARWLGKPIVMKFSGSSLVLQMSQSWLGRLELAFLQKWAGKILILNPGMAEEAKQVGIDPQLLGWMPNPVDTGEFAPATAERKVQLRKQLQVGPDTPVAVFVGRLDLPKELPWLIGAFRKVVDQRPDALLVLVGDGPLREQIAQFVKVSGLEQNVQFTGRLSSTGVREWLQAGDVFTLISAVEGLPCSLIEAMSAGLVPVVSDIPAHRQIVDHEVEGLLTEMGNETSIAEALLRAFGDPDLRHRLGQAARQRMIAECSVPQVTSCYERLFDELLNSAPR